jgi:transcriptional regulator with XRE-family HTH domain
VRVALGENVARIRGLRGMTVRELSAKLEPLGLRLSPSGVSEIENAGRKVSVEELLVLAIALNTSVIDLLTPEDGSPLVIAKGVEPLHPVWLEDWMSGTTPWPPDPANVDYVKAFFGTASQVRQLEKRIAMRPELQEISALRSAVAGAIEGPGTFLNEVEDPKLMSEYLRTCLERVNAYVKLLADKLDKDGYGG